jgi:hypothetical protein
MVPVLPLAPITQMGAVVPEDAVVDAVAALADDTELDQTPLAARTTAMEDATEESKNWRREDFKSATLSLSPSPLFALLDDTDDKG